MPSDHPTLLGLVLAGGQSRRMGRDKASLTWRGQPLWLRQAKLLEQAGLSVLVSHRPEQTLPDFDADRYASVPDAHTDAGPFTGWLSAWAMHPESALLVVACDLPLLDLPTLQKLISQRDSSRTATAYSSANDGLPEPMCAIYEPSSKSNFEQAFAADRRCPRKILIQAGDAVKLLTLPSPHALENANTPEEFERLQALDEQLQAT